MQQSNSKRANREDHFVNLLAKVMLKTGKRDNGTQAGVEALRKSLERNKS